ncbi:MAG: glycosyltransferase [Chitinophagaceae bacterium]|nr:glycosyltransferase [Chitinophagaceae bacterium]MCW5925533.1 glycosyltransferase [Chitinophagaceae bacterium]
MQVKSYISVKATPLVSIITLNWNQTNATCKLLESINSLTYDNFEVLVCDMGSAVDPTFAITYGHYRNARVLHSENARGLTGLNWAISQAKGDFILLLNNNSTVSANLVEELLAPFRENSALGATCPKVVSFHNHSLIHFAGYERMNLFTGKNRIIGHKKTDKGQYDTPSLIHGIYTGAVMIRKHIVENTGAFSENFFVYFNDSDISARILKKGYKIQYQPTALVFNKDVIRYSKKSPMHVYYTTRNRILSMRRNTTLFQFSVFMVFFIFMGIPLTTLKFILFGQFAHLQAFFKGIFWNFKTNGMPLHRYVFVRQTAK